MEKETIAECLLSKNEKLCDTFLRVFLVPPLKKHWLIKDIKKNVRVSFLFRLMSKLSARFVKNFWNHSEFLFILEKKWKHFSHLDIFCGSYPSERVFCKFMKKKGNKGTWTLDVSFQEKKHTIPGVYHISNSSNNYLIQLQVPLQLPCYDFEPIAHHILVLPFVKMSFCEMSIITVPSWKRSQWILWTFRQRQRHSWKGKRFQCSQLWVRDGRGVQGSGTYSPWRADPRLLVIPASCSRVAENNLNWGEFFEICSDSHHCSSLSSPL